MWRGFETQTVTVPLKPAGQPVGKIRVESLQVTIAEEAIFMIEDSGQQLSLAQYLDHTRQKVRESVGVRAYDGLVEVWVDGERRRKFLDDLQKASVYVDVLAEVLGQTEADQFDLLAHLAFGLPIRTRSERAAARSEERREGKSV